MADEEKKKKEQKGLDAWGFLRGLVGLDWIRPLQWKLGGRKTTLGYAALAVLYQMVADGTVSWAEAVFSVGVGLVAGGIAIAIAIEGEAPGEEETNEEVPE